MANMIAINNQLPSAGFPPGYIITLEHCRKLFHYIDIASTDLFDGDDIYKYELDSYCLYFNQKYFRKVATDQDTVQEGDEVVVKGGCEDGDLNFVDRILQRGEILTIQGAPCNICNEKLFPFDEIRDDKPYPWVQPCRWIAHSKIVKIESINASNRACKCDIMTLMAKGCQCGGV